MELHAKVLIVDDDLNPLKGQESVGAKRIRALQTELRVSVLHINCKKQRPSAPLLLRTNALLKIDGLRILFRT